MNDKEMLTRKVIVYTLLSALVILAGRCNRELKHTLDVKEEAVEKGHQPE
ncbi:hypothetical protein [Paenibacillus sp. GCM10028914]